MQTNNSAETNTVTDGCRYGTFTKRQQFTICCSDHLTMSEHSFNPPYDNETETEIAQLIKSTRFKMAGRPKIQKVMVQPINLIFRYLQSVGPPIVGSNVLESTGQRLAL